MRSSSLQRLSQLSAVATALPCFVYDKHHLLFALVPAQVAEISTLFDDDGILVRFMNSNTQGNAVR
jgi:hypothetical protein